MTSARLYGSVLTIHTLSSMSVGHRSRPVLAALAAALLTATAGPLPLLAMPQAPRPSARNAAASASADQDLPSEQDSYILGSGDQLELRFLSPAYAGLGGPLSLLNDGSASLPLLGSVVLDGLTLNQASGWLTSLYRRYLRRPDLILRVAAPRPMQVSVVGEVENPGLYVMSPGGEGSRVEGQENTIPGLPTVVSLIQKAGGITLNANLSDVRLRRRIPADNNQVREVQLNLVALLQQGDKRQNPFLFDGDTLLISRAPAPPPDEVLELAATNLSPQSIQVNIVGEVKNGGRISLPAGTPLMQGILAAGGVNRQRANRSNIELVRINRNGTATLRRYNLDLTQGVSGPRNPPLRDGDSVIVNRSVLATGSDAINTITTPLTGLVNILALVEILRDIGDNNTNN